MFLCSKQRVINFVKGRVNLGRKFHVRAFFLRNFSTEHPGFLFIYELWLAADAWTRLINNIFTLMFSGFFAMAMPI